MTVVRPGGSFKAPKVTLPCRNRPWKIRRRMLGLLTCSSSQPIGQLSKTCFAISVAESFGEKVKSCVFPLTRMRRRFTMSRSSRLVIARRFAFGQRRQPVVLFVWFVKDGAKALTQRTLSEASSLTYCYFVSLTSLHCKYNVLYGLARTYQRNLTQPVS